MKRIKTSIFLILTVLAGAYIFFEAPNLNPLYSDGAFFWAALITAYVVAFSLMKFGEITFNGFSMPNQGDKPRNPFRYNSFRRFPRWIKFVIAIPWIYFVGMIIVSSVFFNWKAYRDQLGEPEIKKFTSEVQAIDISQVPVVDQKLAYNLANKKLGERPSLGSQTTPGEPTIQMVDGELVWVVPLHHSGLFKWLFNMQGTPGYIKISATNANKIDYVEGYKIKYHPNSYLLNDLKRHVRFTKGWVTGITDYSFELDDTGKPFWVVSTYRNKRFFSLPEATGVITVDATTGATEKYKLPDVPEWIDRVQPEDFIVNQINNRGKYVKGIFNFSNKDKYMSSEGHNIVYNGGNNYLFTGLTSVGADESAMGFVMVDMVTKEVIQYQMSGATETAAQRSAMGKVQDLGYRATFPIIINISSTPTYFMTLKDAEGLVKQYAFVSIQNYNIVGTGESMRDAIKDYNKSLRNNGGSSGLISQSNENQTIKGNVLRIAQETNQDITVYKFMIDTQPKTIFIAESSVSDSLALTNVGDSVEFTFVTSDDITKMVSMFDNITLGVMGDDVGDYVDEMDEEKIEDATDDEPEDEEMNADEQIENVA